MHFLRSRTWLDIISLTPAPWIKENNDFLRELVSELLEFVQITNFRLRFHEKLVFTHDCIRWRSDLKAHVI